MSYTVKQIAKLAGVSARTLHYYDEIGLFKPASLGENGYRYYDEEFPPPAAADTDFPRAGYAPRSDQAHHGTP